MKNQKLIIMTITLIIIIGGINSISFIPTVSSKTAPVKLTHEYFFPVIAASPLQATTEHIAFADMWATDLLFHPTEEGHLYVSLFVGGLNESFDNGVTWTQQNLGKIPDIDIRTASPNRMYAATSVNSGPRRSYDGGQSWEQIGPYQTNAVATHPISPTVLLVGTMTHFEGQGGGMIIKSNDDGDSWYAFSDQFLNIQQFAFDPFNTHIVYARGTSHIHKSVDDGDSWQLASDGLPPAHEIYAHDLAVHPENADMLYLAATEGLFVSYDGAENWQLLWGEQRTTAIASGPGVVYVTTDDGLFASWDNGLNWSQYAQCGQDIGVSKLVIDPVDPTQIWIAGSSGLWRCTLLE